MIATPGAAVVVVVVIPAATAPHTRSERQDEDADTDEDEDDEDVDVDEDEDEYRVPHGCNEWLILDPAAWPSELLGNANATEKVNALAAQGGPSNHSNLFGPQTTQWPRAIRSLAESPRALNCICEERTEWFCRPTGGIRNVANECDSEQEEENQRGNHELGTRRYNHCHFVRYLHVPMRHRFDIQHLKHYDEINNANETNNGTTGDE